MLVNLQIEIPLYLDDYQNISGLDIQENTNKELGFQLELLAYNVIL